MATHSSVLAWRVPGTEEPGGLPSMGSHRVGHDRSDLAAAAALCLAHIYSISGILKRDEERKGRNKGRRKAGREGGKEEREEGKREGGGKVKDIMKAPGIFSEDRFRHPFFLNLPKHNPLLLNLLLTFLPTQALPVTLLKYIPVTLLSFSFAIL